MEEIPSESLMRSLCTAQELVSKLLNAGSRESLDILHSLEDILVPTLSTVRCSINSLCPINHCPDDIHGLIFQYSVALIDDTADEFQWPFSSFRPSSKLIDLTHICRRWRILALNLPLLWTHIGDRSSDPLLRAVSTFLQRSRMAPLKFHIRGKRHINIMSDSFKLNLSRMEELHVDYISDLFGLYNSAPALKVLTLDSVLRSVEQMLFHSNTPLLKALTMHSMTWFPKNPLPSLTHLCFYSIKPMYTVRLSGLADFLRACPGLVELIVANASLILTAVDHSPVTLKHLQRLSIGEMRHDVLSWFLEHIETRSALSTRIFGLQYDPDKPFPDIPPLHGSTLLDVGASSSILLVTAADSSSGVRIECKIPWAPTLYGSVFPWASWPLVTITELHITDSRYVSEYAGLYALFCTLSSLSILVYNGGGIFRLRGVLSSLSRTPAPHPPCPSLSTLCVHMNSKSYAVCDALAGFVATRAGLGYPLHNVIVEYDDPDTLNKGVLPDLDLIKHVQSVQYRQSSGATSTVRWPAAACNGGTHKFWPSW